MHYLDTSVLVAALTNEAQTDGVQSWLANQPAESLFISDWVATEFSSALALKLRTGQLSTGNRADALSMFNALAEQSFTVLDLSRRDYHTAARFADRHDTALRAGDALHLAVASRHGLKLWALDRRMVDAGQTLGVSAEYLT